MSPAEPPEQIQGSGSVFLFLAFFFFFSVGLIIALSFEWWKQGRGSGSMYENLGEKNVLMNVFFDIFYAAHFLQERRLGKQNDPGFGCSMGKKFEGILFNLICRKHCTKIRNIFLKAFQYIKSLLFNQY